MSMLSKNVKSLIAALLAIGLLLTAVPAQAKGLKSVAWGKQLFKRASLNNPKLPKYVRGHFRQEVNRYRRKTGKKTGFPRYLKSVPGFDVGHNPMKRNSANPAHMRWETRRANRSRPGRAKASAKQRGTTAKYF
jgi:hypothetical protein